MAKDKIKKGTNKVKSPLFFFIFFLVVFLGFLGSVIYKFTQEEEVELQAAGSVEWTEDGVVVCDRSNDQDLNGDGRAIVNDSSTGAIFSWRDLRGGTYTDVYAQRMNSEGVEQWTNDGVVICNASYNQTNVKEVRDGSGGAIIAWFDDRSSGGDDYYDIYAQRVNASGSVQWTSNGVQVINSSGLDNQYDIVADGSGGVIIVWQDSWSLYAQKLNSSGVKQWSSSGETVCANPTCVAYNPIVTTDSSGGVIVMWADERGTAMDIYAQRMNSSGTAQWTANGVVVSNASNEQGEFSKAIIADGSGGAFMAWNDYRSGSNYDIYAQRINSSGAVQWTANGVVVCNASNNQYLAAGSNIVSDQSSGIIIPWSDGRSGTDTDIYAQRINSSGVVQWTANGVAVGNTSDDETADGIVYDSLNGFIISYSIYDGLQGDVYAQKINDSGAIQWDSGGIVITDASGDQYDSELVNSDTGKAIFTWTDYRSGSADIYTQQATSLLSNGEACTDDGECESGYCTDGYCCVSDCLGTCRSCDQAGHLGECYLHADNTDPDSECSASWDTCDSQCERSGSDGFCDGAGACDTDDATDDIDSAYICTGSGSQTAVSAVNYCNYDEDCDSGDCSATEWYTSCNGSGTCRIASDHTDAYSEGVTPSAGKVMDDSCSETDAGAGTSCDGSVDYYGTAGSCIYSRRYAECDGAGNCDSDASVNYEGSSQNVPDGSVTKDQSGGSGLPYESPSSSNNCEYVEDCDSGDCSATKWYRACGGSGVCRSDNVGADSEAVNAQEGYTLSDTCETDGTTICDYSDYNACTGSCQRQRDEYRCTAGGACTYDVGDDITDISSGYICTGSGSQTAVSVVNYCNYDEDCDSGDCSATEWYTSCNGSGTCRIASDHTDAYSEGVTPSAGKVMDDSCSEADAGAGTSCDGSVDYYGTVGSCIYSRRYAECDGVGVCDTDASYNYEGSSQNVPDGSVAKDQSGGSDLPYESPSSSNNCEYVEDCDSGDCSATKWYRACGGSGVCRSDNVGADSEAVNAQEGYTLSDTCETDGTTICDYSDYNACTGSCQRQRDEYRCTAGGACTYDVGDDITDILTGYICTGSGSQTAVSAVNYCNYDEDCDSGDCSATEWYTSCNGSGTCRIASDHTDAYSEGVTPSAGKVMDDSCSEADAGAGTSCDGSVDYYGTAGSCIYSRRYAECDGAGNCDSDASDNYEGTNINVPVNKVATGQSGGSDLPYGDAVLGTSCNGSVDYYATGGTCVYTQRLAECEGTGVCDDDSSDYFEETVGNVPGGSVAKTQSGGSGTPYETPTSSNYCSLAETCDSGDCSATKYYRACGGSGTCRTNNTGAASENVYAQEGYTLTNSCGVTGTAYCGYSATTCLGSCRTTRTHNKCSSGHACTYVIDTEYTNCSAGTACVNGTCSSNNLCNVSYVYCTNSGDNNYGSGGRYYCQAGCDGSNSCDYAVNCEYSGIIINLDDSLEAVTVASGWVDDATTVFQRGSRTIGIRRGDGDILIAEISVDFASDRDWINVFADTNITEGKSVVSDLVTAPGSGSSHTLYVPIPSGEESDRVVICPLAKTLNEVSVNCSGAITKTEQDLDVNKETISSRIYWVITGLTGTGGISVVEEPVNEAPTITIIEPDGESDIAEENYEIRWSDTDSDNDASISLYHDSDKIGVDGTEIVTGISEDEAEDLYDWDISELDVGFYYVYAIIDDDVNEAVVNYSSGYITKILSGCSEINNDSNEGNDDTDCDGMPDMWEDENELAKLDPTDAGEDPDEDDLNNLDEYYNETDPQDSDTDDDGIPDGWEVDTTLDPTDPSDAPENPDNDGCTNLQEYQNTKQPFVADCYLELPETGEAEGGVIRSALNVVSDIGESISSNVQKVRENESLVAVTKTVAAPIAAIPVTGQAVAVVVTTSSVLLLSPVNILPALIAMIKREKKNHWGIVYDRDTYDPVAFAVIRLESEGKVVTKVSDIQGRYSLIIEPGSYKLSIKHSDFKTYKADVEIGKGKNISIDTDISLERKKISGRKKIYGKIKSTIKNIYDKIGTILLVGGLIVSMVIVVISPTVLNLIMLIMYIPMIIIHLRSKMQYPSNWGKVLDSKDEKPVKGAFVKIFEKEKEGPKLLDSGMTNNEGRYGFVLDKSGSYLILVAASNYKFPSSKNKYPTEFYESLIKVNIGKEKVLKDNLYVDPTKGKEKKVSSPFR